MNLVKMCLAMLLGVVIGIVAMTLVRPQPVKAQGGIIHVDRWDGNPTKIQGSRVVGFSCVGNTPAISGCFIASE